MKSKIENYSQMAMQLKNTPCIGIGEAYHGSEMLHSEMVKLVQALLDVHKTRVIFLENPASDTERLNAWIQKQSGSKKPIPSKYLYKIWRTRPFLSMLRSLRAHNQSHPKHSIQLIGFDIRQAHKDATELMRKCPIAIKRSLKNIPTVKNSKEWKAIEQSALNGKKREFSKISLSLKGLKKLKIANHKSKHSAFFKLEEWHRFFDWHRYLLETATDYGQGLQTRDQAMFRQLKKDLAKTKDPKSIIIGHAVHLIPNAKGLQADHYNFALGDMFGSYLKRALKSKYKYAHFTFEPKDGPTTKALTSHKDSIECLLKKIAHKNPTILTKSDLRSLIKLHPEIKELSSFNLAKTKSSATNNMATSAFGLKLAKKTLPDFLIFNSLG